MKEFNESYLNLIKEDISEKDAFLNMVYDLIDTAFQLGKDPETNEQNPMENEEINDILGSLEAAFDDGRRI